MGAGIATVSVQAGTTTTEATVGAACGVTTFTDDLSAPNPTQARVRVINAAAPQVDVRGPAGEDIASGLAHGAAGPYSTLAPGEARLSVAPAGAPAADLPVTLGANEVSSVVLTSSDGALRARVVVDAGGPPVVPPGPVHAGFGGAAAEQNPTAPPAARCSSCWPQLRRSCRPGSRGADDVTGDRGDHGVGAFWHAAAVARRSGHRGGCRDPAVVRGGPAAAAPESRAASIAVYACCALLTELTTADGVDGRATLLLAAGGMFAAAGKRRSVAAALACVAAVALAPVVGVGVLVLLGVMALRRDLLTRFPVAVRRLAGVAAVGGAAGIVVLLARPGDGPAVPVGVLGVLGACALLIGGAAWVRLPWFRPPVLAVAALVVCQFGPGRISTRCCGRGGGSVLAAVLTEEHHALFARPVLVGAVMVVSRRPPARARHSAAVAPNPVAKAVPVAAVARPQVRPSRSRSRAWTCPGRWTSSASPTAVSCSPDDPSRAGWYAGGVVPGDLGPAIVGGHVDSRRGPGRFFALRSAPGDVVDITLGRSGRTVLRVPGAAGGEGPVPTAVYGPTPRPSCPAHHLQGRFDRTARSYTDNVVVEAVAT
jgi:hypothetical protein